MLCLNEVSEEVQLQGDVYLCELDRKGGCEWTNASLVLLVTFSWLSLLYHPRFPSLTSFLFILSSSQEEFGFTMAGWD